MQVAQPRPVTAHCSVVDGLLGMNRLFRWPWARRSQSTNNDCTASWVSNLTSH